MNIDDINLTLIKMLHYNQTLLLDQQRQKCQQIYDVINPQIQNIKVSCSQLVKNPQNESQIEIKVESVDYKHNLINLDLLKNNMSQLKAQLKMYKRFHNFQYQDLQNQIREIYDFYISNCVNGSGKAFQSNEQHLKKESQILNYEQFNNNNNFIQHGNNNSNNLKIDQNLFNIFSQINSQFNIQHQPQAQNSSKKSIKGKKNKKKQKQLNKLQQIKITDNENQQQKFQAEDDLEVQSNDSFLMKNQQLKPQEQQNKFLDRKTTYQIPKMNRKEKCQVCGQPFLNLILLLIHEVKKHGIIRNSSEIIDPNYLNKKKEWESYKEISTLKVQNKWKKEHLVYKNDSQNQQNIGIIITEQDLFIDNEQEQNLKEQKINYQGNDKYNNQQIERDLINTFQKCDQDHQQVNL